VRVQNFRSIRNQLLTCDELTVLVGPNGAGKSSFLKALSFFYTPSANYDDDDFYNRDTSKEIVITVTFANLTVEEKKLFHNYAEGDDLTVEKVMTWPRNRTSQKYYGNSLVNDDFSPYRAATGSDLKVQYKKLRESKYNTLPEYTNKDAAEQSLRDWERANPTKCVRGRDDGQFFGFKEVGTTRLERFWRFIFVPAVEDASEDAEETKGSPLTEIMDLVVRSVLQGRGEIQELKERTQADYRTIIDQAKEAELRALERSLNSFLQTYVPNAGVRLNWDPASEVDIPSPRAYVSLVEDEYPTPVERCGHGLQRAYILTMLQHLAFAQATAKHTEDETAGGTPDTEPSYLIGIEEPELYQHPNRQRHLFKILDKLSHGGIDGVAKSTQIIYSTHSPLFVDIKSFSSVRRVCKVRTNVEGPKESRVISATLDAVAAKIGIADQMPEGTYSGRTLEPRLQTLMTPWMNEGFFADAAVLVEGEEDRALILGVAQTMGHDLEANGISVIPCMGKSNLDRPATVFSMLGIPVYVIWDSDLGSKDARPEDNHRLLRLLEEPVEDWPDRISDKCACFEHTLSKKFEEEIGEKVFSKCLEGCQSRFSIIKKDHAMKNPVVIQNIVEEARKLGCSSKTVEDIVTRLTKLPRQQVIESDS